MTLTTTQQPRSKVPRQAPSAQDLAYVRLISNILDQSEEKLLADLMEKKRRTSSRLCRR
tara:strand:- start:3504 stop:3680 length:177 start_codon:yes stop_codon:yes gene_type:complete